MKILILLACFFCACGDGNFDFSDQSVGDNSQNLILIREPNEGTPSASDGVTSPIMTNGNPICTEVKGVDGAGNFLSKPESESDGNLVLLFPDDFQTKFKSVKAQLLDGTFEEGRFTGFANGNRQHWRFSMPGSFYSGLYIAESYNGECQWKVDDPSIRQD